jgi:lysophospholipase L1-like esterase
MRRMIMKKKFFLLLILVQLIMIVYLFINIQNKKNNMLGVSITEIDNSNIVRVRNEKLKYFYEPKPDSLMTDQKEWLPYVAKYTLNKDSLNERYDYNISKNEGIFRIVTLGDSFTFGHFVSTPDNWTELLEDHLNSGLDCKKIKKFEVINLGVYGYDTAYEVERYKRRGAKYDPDLVLWMFVVFERNLEKMMPIISKLEKDDFAYEKKGIFYYSWKTAQSETANGLSRADMAEYQNETIKQLDNYYQGQLVFIGMPTAIEYSNVLKQRVIDRQKSFFMQPNINYSEKQYFLKDGHPNKEGHRVIAQDIFNYLKGKKIISCD